MAFGLTVWLFLIFVKGCFANTNIISFNGTSSSTSFSTIVRPSSLAVPNLVNTSTTLPHTTTLLSTLHPLNINFSLSSSILQSPPNETIFTKNNRTFESKLTTIHHTGTKISLTTLTLLPTPLSGNTSVSSPSTLPKANKTRSFNGSLWTVNSSLASNISTQTVSMQQHLTRHQISSTVQFSSSAVVPNQGSNKIFIAEIRILNMTFSPELEEQSSSLFQNLSLTTTNSIDRVMKGEKYYKECKVIEIRSDSGVVIKLEITMGGGSSNEPATALERLKKAVKSGRVGNMNVHSSYFPLWLKKHTEDPSTRESLLSGKLAGVALILFILVVLLLIICLGNFADEPALNERELFTEEVSMENLGRDKDNQGQQEDEEWKFDPLFAWSPRKAFDSKL